MTRKRKSTAAGGPSRAVLYVRVSTDQQADAGHSLETQRVKLEAFALAHDLHVVAVEVDAGESASSIDRPGLQRALARIDAFEADTLLVVKLDRLTRNLVDLRTLIDTYFRDGQNHLMSVSESIDTRSAGGRMMLNLLTVISEWEREAIGERTAAVMKHLRDQGKYTGGAAPYGYTREGEDLVECPCEQAMIARARELRAAGHPLRAVACALGVNPRTGKAFAASQIVRML